MNINIQMNFKMSLFYYWKIKILIKRVLNTFFGYNKQYKVIIFLYSKNTLKNY